MIKIEKVRYSGLAHTKVNRDPAVQRGEHGVVDIKVSAAGAKSYEFMAAELHPTIEQLFAGAWSACWITVLGAAASMKKVALPADTSVDLQVNMGETTSPAWSLGAKFTVRIPGVDQAMAEAIAHLAHQLCPYSQATKGNIEVVTEVITA
ncbi:Ohr family peroxiredoxin [Rhodanobacter sp. MP7CTX1]|jgi:lipoyl-dependent peroxiredoxin|uniref:Ohr family peroxiredoxin n=1 Tax=Rhodanobacter sp. MP7CTX1 TaxID=2723084 RepID=UPI0016145F5F|nr:Ohr family peroxiredoxin [Rhodanobacter sp. MP7CTX1]MBB6189139.1 Ohr subfamily peroxiredoxin [Rhodanobacter sp. MP7CTX1]